MKILTVENTGVNPQTVYVGEETAPLKPVHQQTFTHTSPANPSWPRSIQANDQYILVKRFGCPIVGIHVDDLIALCTKAEPKLSWPPLFVKNSIEQGDVVKITSIFNGENPELSEEDKKISYRWQSGTGNPPQWVDLEDNEVFSGTESNTISVKNSPDAKVIMLRCVATNGAGSAASGIVVNTPPRKPIEQ